MNISSFFHSSPLLCTKTISFYFVLELLQISWVVPEQPFSQGIDGVVGASLADLDQPLRHDGDNVFHQELFHRTLPLLQHLALVRFHLRQLGLLLCDALLHALTVGGLRAGRDLRRGRRLRPLLLLQEPLSLLLCARLLWGHAEVVCDADEGRHAEEHLVPRLRRVLRCRARRQHQRARLDVHIGHVDAAVARRGHAGLEPRDYVLRRVEVHLVELQTALEVVGVVVRRLVLDLLHTLQQEAVRRLKVDDVLRHQRGVERLLLHLGRVLLDIVSVLEYLHLHLLVRELRLAYRLGEAVQDEALVPALHATELPPHHQGKCTVSVPRRHLRLGRLLLLLDLLALRRRRGLLLRVRSLRCLGRGGLHLHGENLLNVFELRHDGLTLFVVLALDGLNDFFLLVGVQRNVNVRGLVDVLVVGVRLCLRCVVASGGPFLFLELLQLRLLFLSNALLTLGLDGALAQESQLLFKLYFLVRVVGDNVRNRKVRQLVPLRELATEERLASARGTEHVHAQRLDLPLALVLVAHLRHVLYDAALAVPDVVQQRVDLTRLEAQVQRVVLHIVEEHHLLLRHGERGARAHVLVQGSHKLVVRALPLVDAEDVALLQVLVRIKDLHELGDEGHEVEGVDHRKHLLAGAVHGQALGRQVPRLLEEGVQELLPAAVHKPGEDNVGLELRVVHVAA
eukprot:PhM_4_TR17049/c0_g1_i2/m.8525